MEIIRHENRKTKQFKRKHFVQTINLIRGIEC